MAEKTKSVFRKCVFWWLMGASLGINAYRIYNTQYINPHIDTVQEGYIAPSKLEINCEDKDKNGQLETYIKVGDKTYALMVQDSTPVMVKYNVQGPQIAAEK